MTDAKNPAPSAFPQAFGIDTAELTKALGDRAGPLIERMREAAERLENMKPVAPPSVSWRPERPRRRRPPARS